MREGGFMEERVMQTQSAEPPEPDRTLGSEPCGEIMSSHSYQQAAKWRNWDLLAFSESQSRAVSNKPRLCIQLWGQSLFDCPGSVWTECPNKYQA